MRIGEVALCNFSNTCTVAAVPPACERRQCLLVCGCQRQRSRSHNNASLSLHHVLLTSMRER